MVKIVIVEKVKIAHLATVINSWWSRGSSNINQNKTRTFIPLFPELPSKGILFLVYNVSSFSSFYCASLANFGFVIPIL